MHPQKVKVITRPCLFTSLQLHSKHLFNYVLQICKSYKNKYLVEAIIISHISFIILLCNIKIPWNLWLMVISVMVVFKVTKSMFLWKSPHKNFIITNKLQQKHKFCLHGLYFLQRNDSRYKNIYSFFRPHQGGSCKAAHQCKEGGAEVPEDK